MQVYFNALLTYLLYRSYITVISFTPAASVTRSREVIRPEVIEEVIVSCVIKHLGLIDSLQSLVNLQYREEHREEYELLCKIMAETFKKINAMERQLQVCRKYSCC